jgi:DNA-directed RNA polymerase specialized sigma24 family protein
MSKGNPFQDQINRAGFDQRLMQGDSDAWGILLEYVRKQIGARPLSSPRGLDRQEAIEEYTGQACNHIAHELGGFQKRGLLSAYIDKLIRTAVANQDVKRLMEATSRFLMATGQLPGSYQRELREIVRRRPAGECAMLLAFMDGQQCDLSGWRRQRLWYDARRGLLYDQDFDYWLHKLAREKHRQANTLLGWCQALGEAEQALPDSVEDEEETALEKFPDPAPTPLEELLRREASQKLIECLEKLRQRSGHHYRAIVRRFDYDESSEQIAMALGASKAATVRQWIQRGLESLRGCMGGDQINGGSDERYDL